MFQVHKAHIVMLTEENLMKKEEAKFILHALKKVEEIPEEQLLYTEQHEDSFFSGTFNFSRSEKRFCK